MLGQPMLLAYTFENGASGQAEAGVPDPETFKVLDDASRDQVLAQMEEGMKDIPDTMTDQAAVQYIRSVYEKLGMDMDAIQTDYILLTGGKMLALAALGMLASITVGLIASRVAASVGREARGNVFRKVVGFSSGGVRPLLHRLPDHPEHQRYPADPDADRHDPADGAVRAHHGRGRRLEGAEHKCGHDLDHRPGRGADLYGRHRPLPCCHAEIQDRAENGVDRLNLVSREILTGIQVIRAFGTETYEEERFDAANRDLTRLNLFVNRAMTFMMPVMMLVMNGISVLIVWTGAHSVNEGAMQVGRHDGVHPVYDADHHVLPHDLHDLCHAAPGSRLCGACG